MNNAFIIHVGANLKENKGLSPIFKDNTYEYIPSPLETSFNTSKHHNHKHYSKMNCQNLNLRGMHMSSFVDEGTGHVDPEFYTFTYGETRTQYISILSKLKKDDLLLFSITLQKYDSKKDNFVLNGDPNNFIFGYFLVNDLDEASGPIDENKLVNFHTSCSEHIIYRKQHIQSPDKKKVLLIRGQKNESAIFKKPLKYTDHDTLLPKFKKNWDIESINKNLEIYRCLNYSKILKDLQDQAENNRWVDWIIP
ncbi:hypothetical protein QEJ31_01400 [Pigmentibacter sp. JX0631]|uniref:Nmad3 family putative nucleotide modification protein n=1 Tax=Pigmentibacter sp. JX0631 TaxID=2976982 RepID=UPI0024698C8A|nr:hypothetical protein [Pigmentibacter sp. JX0631]WGL60260.1 hypothetical protein QEJ31_01400 [Pigmentibacter sp. JX0631]